MKHLKLLLIPVIASLLGGCSSNNSSYMIPEPELDYGEVLTKYGLDDSFLCKDISTPTYFSGYNHLMPESKRSAAHQYKTLNSLKELKKSCENLGLEDRGQFSYIDSFNAEAFDNINVIFSPEYIRNNPSYSYSLINVYFKGDDLYLHINRSVEQDENVAYPEVVMHTCFALQIKKTVEYSNIKVVLTSAN